MIIYTAIIFLVAIGFLSKYSLQFNLFAIIVGLFGAFSLKDKKSKEINKKLHYFLLISGLILIFLIRIIPYFFTNIPLGYDPGIYKYGIEKGLENKDKWILEGGMEPGFLYLMQPFKLFFSTDFILKYLFVFFCVLLGFSAYLVAKEYFNEKAALISLFVFAFSLVQFKTFWFLYYKNVIGMSTMLFSLYFLKKYEKKQKKKDLMLFILFAGLTGAIHRPTFYIFGLSYFFYAFISPYENKKYNFKLLKKNIIFGVLILLIFFLFYIGDFFSAITSTLPWIARGFVEPGQSPGTFIDFKTYQYSILPYFAMAVLGLVFSLRRNIKILEIWALLNLVIIIFQFFFFNRFIIMLDLVLILFASLGFFILSSKKKIGTLLLIIIIFSSALLSFKEAKSSKPLVDETELEAIIFLSKTPENSFVMSTSSYYSTWIIGYSERKTIAPGLFDYNKHAEKQWINFWTTEDLNEIKKFLNVYKKPLYIFVGKKQKDNLAQFLESNCFNIFYENSNNKIYEYLC